MDALYITLALIVVLAAIPVLYVVYGDKAQIPSQPKERLYQDDGV